MNTKLWNHSLLLTIGVALLGLACTGHGQIRVTQDSFKQRTIGTLPMIHYSDENVAGIWRVETEAIYTREVGRSPEESVPLSVRWKFLSAGNYPALKSEAFVRIDAENYPLALTDIQRQVNVQITQTNYQYANNSGTPQSTTSYSHLNTQSQAVHTATMRLTAEQEEGIRQCRQLSFRLYFPDVALTFTPGTYELGKIKELVQLAPGVAQ